ncbi:MAG: ATP-binding protein [Promethearchaeota archaeon]
MAKKKKTTTSKKVVSKKATNSKKTSKPKQIPKKSSSKKKFTKKKSSSKPSVELEPQIDEEKSIEPKKNSTISNEEESIIRLPAEQKYKEELLALQQNDSYPKPLNWLLSPKMVEIYICGSKKKYPCKIDEKTKKVTITTKFYGSTELVQKAIVTLASQRSLMLIGEPGTGKSWLSEHLSAAISGKSTYLVQGTAGTTEDSIRYSWNYALLISEGPTEQALVKSPTIKSMEEGKILRIEELTRCPQEIQDTLISILSEKIIPIPELGKDFYIMANKGFNVIATANDRDRGVNEMSAALKRRFNFLYIPVVDDPIMEKKIIESRVGDIMDQLNFKIQVPSKILDLVTTSFHDLRYGRTREGRNFKKISSVMSVSEEISLILDTCLHSFYFGDQVITPESLAHHFGTGLVKTEKQNIPILFEYINLIVMPRGRSNNVWKEFGTALEQSLRNLT